MRRLPPEVELADRRIHNAVLIVMISTMVIALAFVVRNQIDKLAQRITAVEVRKTPPPKPDARIGKILIEQKRLRADLDVCHQRVTDAFWSLDIVSRVPGKRAHAPRPPERKRP